MRPPGPVRSAGRRCSDLHAAARACAQRGPTLQRSPCGRPGLCAARADAAAISMRPPGPVRSAGRRCSDLHAAARACAQRGPTLQRSPCGPPGTPQRPAHAGHPQRPVSRAPAQRPDLGANLTAKVVEQSILFCYSGTEDFVPALGGTVTSSATASRWRWLAFAAAVAAAVMDLLDSTIAQVAAPAIQRDLGGSYAVVEWITAAYTLAMAVGLLTGGRLGDLFGRKRMLLIGMAGFVAASAACAAAVTPGQLIAARAVQGAAGAVMLPQVFGLIRDLFSGAEIGKAFAVFSPVMGLSAMLGPVASGGLISADILGTGWRMIFLVNLPAGARLLPSGRSRDTRARLDLPGAALAGAAMFLVVFPLVQGRALGWPVWLVAMLAAAAPVLAGFAWYQVRRQRAGATPLIEPGIFARRGYAPGVAFSVAFVGSMGGIVLVFNVFLRAGLGFSPWHSALTTAPWAAGAFVGSAAGGMSMARLGRRVLHAGLV